MDTPPAVQIEPSLKLPEGDGLLPASRHWATVARNRQRFPSYTALLPRTATGIRLLEAFMIGAISLAGSYLLWSRSHIPSHVLLLTSLFCAFYALGGVRRGQDNYAAELERALSVGPVLGVSPAGLYVESTLRAAKLRFLTASVTFPLCLVLVGLSLGVPSSSLAVVGLSAGLLPTMAMLAREAIAHLSVGLRRVLLPKYIYLLAGLVVGVGAASLVTLLSPSGSAAAASLRKGPGTQIILLSAAACVVEILAAVVLFRVTGAMARRVARRVKPVSLETRPKRWRPPAVTPLCVLMWRSRGRGRSSVIIGFTALVVSLVLQMHRLAGLLPRPARHSDAYLRPELAVVLLYAIIYFSAILFEAPLEMRLLKQRRALLAIAAVRPGREAWDLFTGVLVPTGAVALIVGWLGSRGNLFPGLAPVVVMAIAVLLAIGGSSVVASVALNGGALSASRSRSDDSTAVFIRAGLFVLLPGMLVAGYSAAHTLRGWQIAAVSVVPFVVGALVLVYMNRLIGRQLAVGR